MIFIMLYASHKISLRINLYLWEVINGLAVDKSIGPTFENFQIFFNGSLSLVVVYLSSNIY